MDGDAKQPALPDDRSSVGSVSKRIRARRQQLGISLGGLAERVGCAKSYLSAVENGHKGPPSVSVLMRIESALDLSPGSLVEVADWEHTPGPIKRDLARLRLDRRSLDQLTDLITSEGLDAAYRSGALGKLIDRVAPDEPAPELAALPVEVPLINKVTAGYPHEFTDLGYPARVADEYVRCPDLHDADAFAARVVGDSMEPDYIAGDIVVFSPARQIADGNDCFIRFEPDHESTFKRVYFEQGDAGAQLIRVQPINNKYPPKTVPRERVAGLYRAVSVMRTVS